jgi:predicted nucleotidyltransferase
MANLGNLLKYLLENKLDFVLIGGFAGVLHGSSSVTKDVDICALLSTEQIDKLRQILRPLNPKHRMTPQKLSFMTNPIGNQVLNNLYLDTDLGQLDILTEVKGVGGFEEIATRSVTVEVFGYPCKIMSMDDLIASKKAMGRDKDKIVLRELEIIRKRKEE